MIEITQVNVSLDEAGDENTCLIVGKRVAKRILRCKDSEIKSIELHRKSIDARKKRDVHFILSFRVELTSPHLEREAVDSVAERDRSRVRAIEDDEPSFPSPVSDAPQERPVVVGAGCAGLFAALTLAKAGLKPLLIERGDPAFRRSQAIDLFLKERILDPESNIQFGLGGAGTFSDGKLTTGIHDSRISHVLDTFVAITAGLIIFPACFSYGVEVDSGPNLIFITLPSVFTNMAGGRVWGALFFLFMTFASFSTVIAVIENIMSSCMDLFGWSRKKAAVVNGALILIASIPCVLGYNVLSGFHPIGGRDVLDSEDFLVSSILLPLGSLVYLLFCVTRWGWGFKNYQAEANTGKGMKVAGWMRWLFMIVLPIMILAIFFIGLMG